VNLLGPVSVDSGDGGEVVVGAAKERSLLAALALRPGSVIAVDALVDAIRGETAPPSARKTLQTYVKNLRRALGPDGVVTHPSGYSLSLRVEDTDLGRFRTLVRQGEQDLRAGRLGPARQALAAAVALGQGRPLAGVGRHTGLAVEAVRLEEEFLTALESRIEADLATGSGAELVGELEVLVGDHPFRERLWAYLLVASTAVAAKPTPWPPTSRSDACSETSWACNRAGNCRGWSGPYWTRTGRCWAPPVRRNTPRRLRCAAPRSALR
jgi:DNA-binding SARP family transcriptional activator